MMRSLFSAIMGLKNHQTMMDVVGNNIANVNTMGFKASRAMFQDVMSQTIGAASGATATLGGRNPMQIGLGTQLASIDTILSQGNHQATGRPTDLAIQGDGYFVVSDNASTPAYFFTRDGNLSLGVAPTAADPRPLIHSATGYHVKGWVPPQAAGTADSSTAPTADVTIPATQGSVAVTGFNVAANGIVSLSLADGTSVDNYAQVAVALFPNGGGLSKSGNNLFVGSANSGAAAYNGASANGRGQLSTGFLEMSNVDLAAEFTNMIIAQRGFQANARVITASDEILQDLVNLKR